MKNILVVTSTFLPRIGGAEIDLDQIVRGLQARGHRVTLLTGRFAAPLRDTHPVPIEFLPPGTLTLFRYWPSLARWALRRRIRALCQKRKIEVVQWVMAYPLATAFDPALQKAGVYQTVRTCGYDIQKDLELGYGARCSPAAEAALKEALPRYDSVQVYAENIRNELDALGVPRERQRVISPGIPARQLAEATQHRDSYRSELNWTDRFVLVTVGRNHVKKGFDLLPAIAGHLVREIRNLRWIVIGGGMAPLERAVTEAGLSAVFEFTGPISSRPPAEHPSPELVKRLVAADLFVFPTRRETFGIVTIEAMGSGLVPVVSDIEGCRDIVTHGKNGLLVPKNDIAAFAEAIGGLYRDPATRVRLREEALAEAARYDWSRVLDRFEQLYSEATPSAKTRL